MRRLLRTSLTAASMLSLVLLTLTLVFWCRSYWVFDGLECTYPRRSPAPNLVPMVAIRNVLRIASCDGSIRAELDGVDEVQGYERESAVSGHRWEWLTRTDFWSETTRFATVNKTFGPIQWHEVNWVSGLSRADHVRLMICPYWVIAGLFAAWPSGRLIRSSARCVRAHRRSRAGCCPACGYDVRATPRRCPECGARPGGAGG